jgi:hypothetical protein
MRMSADRWPKVGMTAYEVALPDQTEVWVRGVDLLGLKAKK